MKKLFIAALALMVSACACFDCEDDVPVYQTTRSAHMNCDHFDGKTCYRYVYKTVKRPVVQPAPVRYRPCGSYQPAQRSCCAQVNSCNSCNACESKISETREPVEIVYKKTTYKTVYEPKTYSQVSYENVPYNSVSVPEPIEVVDESSVLLNEEVK